MEMASETTQNSALRTDEAASHGPLWRLIDCAVTAHANRAKVPVNRKAYLRWCLLGVFGAQGNSACWQNFRVAPAQYAEKQLLLLVIISGKIAFHFRADMLN